MKRAASLGGVVALAFALVASCAIALSRPIGYDFVAYTDAASRLIEGRPIYASTAEVVYLGAGEFLYPPPVAVLFVPFALIPQELSRALWSVLLVAVAAAVAWRPLRALPASLRYWIAAACALFLPLIAELTLGNVNLLTLALCQLAWLRRGRPLEAGASLALGVGLKLLPVLIPLFFLVAGHARVVAWAMAVGLAAVLATLPWLAPAWSDYFALLLQVSQGAPAQALTLVPEAFVGGIGRLLLVLLALLATAAAAIAARRRPERAMTACALALAAVPLVAPGIWYPYLVFALPLLLWIAVDHGRAPRSVGEVGVWVMLVAGWAALQVPKRTGEADIAFVGLLGVLATGAVSLRTRSR